MPNIKTLPNGHPGEIVLFSFPESVYGRRMVRYMNLRGLPYSQIRVPPKMPRTLLQERLGINYRRIPIMSIGRDIYIDSRLMLSKLEEFFPEGGLKAPTPWEAGFEEILEEWVIDGGPYWRTAGCIPVTAPLVQDEAWMKDRYDGSGGLFTMKVLVEDRAWSLSQLKIYFGMLEKMLKDGRMWILGRDQPTLAEIHAGWVYDWAVNMAVSMQDGSDDASADIQKTLSRDIFPNVHTWVERFRNVTEKAAAANTGGGPIDEGQEAEDDIIRRILSSNFTEPSDPSVDTSDVLVSSEGLKAGQRVSVAPVDFGRTYKNEGTLVGLSANEVVIEMEVPSGEGTLRLHYPRINFKILPV